MSALRLLFICLLSCAGALPFAAKAAVTNCASAAALQAELARTNRVVFACSGTITLSSPIVIAADTTLDATGREVTLSGNNATRIFVVNPGVTLRLTNINLINGKANQGGAILNRGLLLATDCLFSGNTATGANGADGRDGDDSTTRAEDGGDGAPGGTGLGGAIYNEFSVGLTRCTFATNTATGGNGGKGGNGGDAVQGGSNSGDGGNGGAGGVGRGGAIFNQNYVAITDCTFERNAATGGNGGALGQGGTGGLPGKHGRGGVGAVGGGAAVHNSFFLWVRNSTFADNRANGGHSQSTSVINNSAGESGPAGGEAQGGGICNFNTAYVVNSTFSTNRAFGGSGGNGANGETRGGRGGDGGAGTGGNYYNNGTSTSAITNCTFAGGAAVGGTNGVGGTGATPGNAGALGANRGGNIARVTGQLWLKNSIIARPGAGANGFGAITDIGYNLSSDASIAMNSGTSFPNRSPLIGGLANNGGPTRTFALQTNSPCIDMGDEFDSPVTDQRGFSIFGFARDIGAFEFAIATISGYITNASGEGLGGIGVALGSIANTVTESDGYFEFPRLAPGTYTVTPTDAFYAFVPPSITVELNGPDTNVFFTALSTFTVSGHVRDAAGGVQNITVRIGTHETQTDEEGFWEIGGLTAGPYDIEPEGAGYAFVPEVRQINLQGDMTGVDFSALGLHSISGRVTFGPTGLANVTVRAGNRTAVTGPGGDYFITQVPAGTQIVTPSLTDFAFTPSSRPVVVDGDETGINFAAHRAYGITGVITHLTNGLPAENVLVTLRTNVTGPPPPGTTFSTSTDTNGAFAFTNVPPGNYVLTPQNGGHAFIPGANTFTLNTSTNFVYSMYRVFSIAGRLLAGSTGVTNAAVTVRTNGSANELMRIHTDTSGNYRFTNLTAGTYDVRPDVPGYTFAPTNYLVDLQANTNGLDFISQGVFTISGTVRLGGATNGLPDVTVRSSSGAFNVTDASGRYIITNVHPGTYSLTPSRNPYGFVPSTAQVTVGPSQANVDFEAVPTYSIRGKVTEGVFPLAGAQVVGGGKTNVTNLDGDFTLANVPASSNVVVAVTSAGYRFTPAQRSVVLDRDQSGVNFGAVGLSSISGRVIDARTSNGLGAVTITAGPDGRYRTNTAVGGAYTLTNVGPGTVIVTPVRADRGFLPASHSVTLAPGGTTNGINFTLYRGYRVTGRVFEEGDTNRPIGNVTITAVQPPTDQHRGVTFTNTAVTDAEGNYVFAAMHEGFNTVTPSRAGLGFNPQFVQIDVTSPIDNLDFEGFQGFTISGRITDPTGTNGIVDVEITPAGTTNNVLPVSSGANGNYTINGLRPDTYTVTPVRPGYRFTPMSRQLEVGPNASGINFIAEGTLTLNGRVLEGAAGLTGAVVRLTSTNNPPLNRSMITDASGNFVFTDLTPGFVSLAAEPVGMFNPTNASVNLDPDLFVITTNFFANGGRLAISRQSNNVLKITLTALPSRSYFLQTNTAGPATPWSDYLPPINTAANGIAERILTNAGPGLLFRSRR